MTLYQWAQLVLAAAVCALIYRRARVLWFDAPLEAKALVDRGEKMLLADQFDAFRALAKQLGPTAWLGRMFTCVGTGAPDLEQAERDVDELLADLKDETLADLKPLRVLASLGTMSGLLGAAIEITHGATPDTSIRALEAGLPARLAFANAMDCMALGIAITVVAGMSLRVFRRDAVRLFGEARVAADRLCAALVRDGASRN